jgi:biopolymer transport protein ExbD
MASQLIKRQRQRRRVDTDGDPEFQVAPMVDVLLVLMLFFMAITSTEILKKDKNLQLPEADHAKPADQDKKEKHNEVVVNVNWGNNTATFSMDQLVYPSTDALAGALAEKYHRNPQVYVLIRADQDVEYSNIADVMTACATAGIGTVSFAAIKDPAKAGGIGPATTK